MRRELAAVECRRSVGGDLFQRAGKRWLGDDCRQRRRRTVTQERPSTCRIGTELGEVVGCIAGVVAGCGEPIPCKGYCRSNKFSPCLGSVRPVQRRDPAERTRHGNAARAVNVDSPPERIRRCRCRRSAGSVINEGGAGGGKMDVIEPIPAEPGHHWLNHAESERDRDSRIGCVTARPKHVEPRLRCERVVRSDGTAAAHDQRTMGVRREAHRGSPFTQRWTAKCSATAV